MMARESVPLLTRSMAKKSKKTKFSKPGYRNHAFDMTLEEMVAGNDYWENEFNEDNILFADAKKRGTSLLWNDFCLLSIEYLQWLGMIQSLSLRWPWPESWIKSMVWIFAVSMDPWEIAKVSSNATYKSIQDYSTDSALMPFQYWHLLTGWAVVLAILCLGFGIAYCTLVKQNHPFLMVKIANMQRVCIILVQVIALPLGITLGKVFHCVSDDTGEVNIMYVDKEQTCMSGVHWGYMATAVGVWFSFYIVFVIWLVRKTRLELIFSHSSGHEAYLQLKETEYAQGLDIVYIVSGFHIFSSFKLLSAHFRAASHVLKLVAIILYAALFYYTAYQAMALAALMLVYMVAFAILRPFRVKFMNALLCINYICLALNLMTGALRSSFDVYSGRSVWFTPQYTTGTLIVVNGAWAVVMVAILINLVLHQTNVLKTPIWPSLTSDGVEKLEDHTKKFMKGVLVARHVVERSMSLPAIFAPAHELSRQVQIINAYCREAELLSDPLQDTLWHLLDEIIEVHSQIAPRSLFSESVKETIRSTASNFMLMMPKFAARLAQREFDFLLVNPVKRRMLLKMYCMGIFLNGRPEKVRKKQLNEEALEVIWTQDSMRRRETTDYIRELQPENEFGPRTGQTVSQQMELFYESDDSLSAISEDSTSVNIDQMMQGIPNQESSSSVKQSAISSASRRSERNDSRNTVAMSRTEDAEVDRANVTQHPNGRGDKAY